VGWTSSPPILYLQIKLLFILAMPFLKNLRNGESVILQFLNCRLILRT